ncbi:acyl-CoA synthetase FdrA, partial [Mammaliicoccus sciuri]|nr:acyl-CoA synthetase FdrA [Mammaliicoccus sciuri]
STAIIMLDNVIGYGSHDDMASELAPTIQKVLDKAQSEGRSLAVFATVVGTEHDHQGYDKQVNILKEAGAIVCETNNQMVTTALHLLGKDVEQPQLETKSFEAESVDLTVDEKVLNLINMKPSVINIGLKSFTEAIQANDAQVVQFNWQPIAGGDEKLMKVLQFLNNYEGETV